MLSFFSLLNLVVTAYKSDGLVNKIQYNTSHVNELSRMLPCNSLHPFFISDIVAVCVTFTYGVCGCKCCAVCDATGHRSP